MRNTVVELPRHRPSLEQRDVLRIAVRQLERADLYLGAVEALEIADAEADEALDALRDDVERLRTHLVDARARLVE